jgi:hypothetical protein
MDQVPKIVTQRLQATAKAGAHPDPNLLTALVEKSLTERERVQVLAHMAQCADCRDIVAASLPEFERLRVAAAAAAPARSGWLSGSVLRWGAAVACMVVVGAAVSLYRRANIGEAPRKYSAVAEKVAPPPAGLTAQQPQAATRDAGARAPTEEKLAASAAPTSADLATPRAKEEGAFSKQLGRQAPAKSRTLAASPEPLRTDTELPAQLAAAVPPATKPAESDKRADYPRAQVEVSSATATDQLADKSSGSIEVAQAAGKAKDSEFRARAAATGAIGGGAMANRKVAHPESAQDEGQFSYANNLVLPRWTLSADGTLQRSLDAGKTWQTIHVPGNVTFRALAAVGAEIWVGGAQGALYHSSDAGGHWLQVKPVTDGKPLTADIIGVEFTDARSGKLTTAGGEIWTTTDAGQTWQSK